MDEIAKRRWKTGSKPFAVLQTTEEKMNKKKSIGSLHVQKRDKPRSPDLVGTITIQRDLLHTFGNQIGDDLELVACVAAWHNQSNGEPYLTVELSPKYRKGDGKIIPTDTVFSTINRFKSRSDDGP